MMYLIDLLPVDGINMGSRVQIFTHPQTHEKLKHGSTRLFRNEYEPTSWLGRSIRYGCLRRLHRIEAGKQSFDARHRE